MEIREGDNKQLEWFQVFRCTDIAFLGPKAEVSDDCLKLFVILRPTHPTPGIEPDVINSTNIQDSCGQEKSGFGGPEVRTDNNFAKSQE